MLVGDRVEVRSRFDQRWSRGFLIADILEVNGRLQFQIQRRSDNSLLPTLFTSEEVREEKKRETWWL